MAETPADGAANRMEKPATPVLVDAVRHHAHQMLGGKTVDEVMGCVAEKQEEYGPKVQQMLF